jgi:hypothetical protein
VIGHSAAHTIGTPQVRSYAPRIPRKLVDNQNPETLQLAQQPKTSLTDAFKLFGRCRTLRDAKSHRRDSQRCPRHNGDAQKKKLSSRQKIDTQILGSLAVDGLRFLEANANRECFCQTTRQGISMWSASIISDTSSVSLARPHHRGEPASVPSGQTSTQHWSDWGPFYRPGTGSRSGCSLIFE